MISALLATTFPILCPKFLTLCPKSMHLTSFFQIKDTFADVLKFGITHYIDLTEEGEHLPYANMLESDVQHIRFPIKDMSAPHNIESVKELTSRINEILHERDGNKIYIHCWGGVGRTGMIVGCLLSEQYGFDFEKTMDALALAYSDCPKSAYRETPESNEQRLFIAKYAEKNETGTTVPNFII